MGSHFDNIGVEIQTTMYVFFFFFNDPPTPEIYTLSLPDALPICRLLFFGHASYECVFQTFGDGCIVDHCTVIGHHNVFTHITLGPCYMSGVLHRECYVMANSTEQKGQTAVQIGRAHV